MQWRAATVGGRDTTGFEAFGSQLRQEPDVRQVQVGNIGQAAKHLQKYNGTTPFAVAYVTQHALGGHSIPLNRGALITLHTVGVISDDEFSKGIVPGLERTVSKNKAAAWKFIEFAASHAENSKWNESAGAIPANTEAAKDPWITGAEPTKLAAAALTDGSTKIVQLPYYLPDWNNISKADNEPEFQKLLLGKVTAQAFLDKIAKELNDAQAEWKQQNKS